jgi:hypothetical protein
MKVEVHGSKRTYVMENQEDREFCIMRYAVACSALDGMSPGRIQEQGIEAAARHMGKCWEASYRFHVRCGW